MNVSNAHHGLREAATNPEDDWRFISDRRVRKRIQNKLSQRKHRARIRTGSDAVSSSLASSPAVSTSSQSTQSDNKYNTMLEGGLQSLSCEQSPISALSPLEDNSIVQDVGPNFETLMSFPGSWEVNGTMTEAAPLEDHDSRARCINTLARGLHTDSNQSPKTAPVDQLAQSLMAVLSKETDRTNVGHSPVSPCSGTCSPTSSGRTSNCSESTLLMALRTICLLLESQQDKSNFVCASCQQPAARTLESGSFRQAARNNPVTPSQSSDASNLSHDFLSDGGRDTAYLGTQTYDIDQFCSFNNTEDEFWTTGLLQEETTSPIHL